MSAMRHYTTADDSPASATSGYPGGAAVAADLRLTPTALRLLLSLPFGGWVPLTQREIAARIGLNPKHVGRQLRALVAYGYVERQRVRGESHRYSYRMRRLAA